MPVRRRTAAFALVLLAADLARAQPAADLDKRLVGAWVFHANGAHQEIIELRADHTAALHARCFDQADMAALAVPEMPVTWRVVGDRLRLTVDPGADGSLESRVEFVGDELRLTNDKGEVDAYQPWHGPLPPPCPAAH